MSTNEQDVVNHNKSWVYVPSFPLCANIVLIDPSTAEQAVDSRIKQACICRVKIDSNSSDLFTKCIKCEHKEEKEHNRSIQWIIDSDASMVFTRIISDFSDLIYYKPEKRPAVSTANSVTFILGFGTVFIQTTLKGHNQITRVHPVFYLPNMKERLLSMGQILHGNLCIYGDQNALNFVDAESIPSILMTIKHGINNLDIHLIKF